MSGTSLDGVGVVLLETDGECIAASGPTGYRAYSQDKQTLLRQALAQGTRLSNRTARPGVLAEAEAFVTHTYAEAVEKFLADERINRAGFAIMLADRLAPASVETADAVGWSSHADGVIAKP